MKQQRLFPTYVALSYEDNFMKYLRLVGKTSKLTESAFKAGSSFKGEYNLVGEVRGNIYLHLRDYNDRIADFSLFPQALVFADLFYDKSEMLFEDTLLYEAAAQSLYDWAKKTKALLEEFDVTPTYCSHPTAADRARFELICSRIDWEGFFIALSYITNTVDKTLSSCIDEVMFTSLATGMLV